MQFGDRAEAGRKLAARLAPALSPLSVVAAIPRQGVAVALPIVERLALPLTLVYARKLTAPFAPELAFGAVDEDGHAILDHATVTMLELSLEEIEKTKAQVGVEIRQRVALYRVPPLGDYLRGRGAVLVDDGVTTGLTMRAAVAYARRHGARDVTVATPCASGPAAERLRREADKFVSLVVDEQFHPLTSYYVDFRPVPDEEVAAMLARAREAVPPSSARAPGLPVSFKNSRGLRLAGELFVPGGGGPHPVVVFAHGRDGGKDNPRTRAAAEALRAFGIAALLFDFTGHGESEGTKEESTQAQQIDDLGAAVGLLARLAETDAGRVGLAGANSGAPVALALAAEGLPVRALVLRSAGVDGTEAVAPRVAAPALLIVGEQDPPTLRANEALLARLAGPRRLEVVPRGDHLLEQPEARQRADDLTVDWFKQHIA
jgi:putative phosphoribosyl transferase